MSKKPMNTFTFLATCYPLGQMPKAPGTWGSLPGLALGSGIYYLARHSIGNIPFWFVVTSLLFVFSIFSYWVIKKTETLWDAHDDKSIVIDEVAGQAIPIAFFAPSWELWLVGFALFRLFDITKPLFIGWVDRGVYGPFGTLLDDLLAGIVVLGILILDFLTVNWIVGA
ncbi:phosphatidylglycerophosphatase A family protein [Pseudobacteriovorax antillogorgiicola]|uniref:Phosphatidylglycerophosphatase n=1 Tax=Pseudobacteriovorax antillogorgiicola TaxID=1513793 RepID=A0A1Y6CPI9_9BACT|nr:phosphatidylglycerophosphatase A [Pseudobacteriovorax antillogorgiicola]TCS46638.1 phosphatidylglycerophosphatase [Pseudobacteriovorax antillogorgiicola]SMF66212.1 phosphatidylglycerophosphatase [Pseudobacteriovorax antillogorgiicola]